MNNAVKRDLIKDRKLSAAVKEAGFGVVSFIDRNEIAALQALFFDSYGNETQPVIFNSLEQTAPEKRKAIHEEILSVCNSAIAKHVENYKVVIAMFFVKNPGEDGVVGIHHDPSMTTENFAHLGIWIPLTDTDEKNGTMNFIRGSHKFFPPYHGKSIPARHIGHRKILDEYMEHVNVRVGEAVIFDNNTLHCTYSNQTGKTRAAVVVKLIDKDAPVVSYFRDEQSNGKIEVIKHNDDYYISPDLLDTAVRPQKGETIGYLDYNTEPVSEEEMKTLLESMKGIAKPKFLERLTSFFS